jgi:hypothetical protein
MWRGKRSILVNQGFRSVNEELAPKLKPSRPV